MKRNHPAASCEGKIRLTAILKRKKPFRALSGGPKKEAGKEIYLLFAYLLLPRENELIARVLIGGHFGGRHGLSIYLLGDHLQVRNGS